MQHRFLSIVMATMASLSATLLGMGQRSLLLPLLTILAALGSVVFTDTLKWFHLNRFVANGAMVLAAFFSLYGFMESGSHQQLLAIASLLIYVQIVLLFQQKSRRVYGQLAMFSLLQVVVAALLNHSLEFGLLLIAYMMLALLGFVLFFIYREVDSVGTIRERRLLLAVDEGEWDGEVDSILGGPPRIQVLDTGPALTRKLVAWPLGYPLLAMATATALFAAVFFFTTPRTGGGNWESRAGARSYVGFSPEVSYEEMNRILLNDARVMRVSFVNAKTGQPYTVIGEPYLRGGILTKYLTAGGQGQWRQEVEASSAPGITLTPPPETRELVRQDVLLEPTGEDRLFSVFPVYGIAATPQGLRIGNRTRRLFRTGYSGRELRDEFRYSIATTGFRFGAQIAVVPHPNRVATSTDQQQMERSLRWLRFIDSREEFPRLIALANQIVQEKAPDGNHYAKARALEAHFLAQNAYKYSLDLSELAQVRNPRLDPIEDFVSHHRTGHCEYFAGALTLMLRSQGIPARMVVGYQGGDFNYVGNYYVVRQRDAHAWVEAYLALDEIPADTLYPEERHAGGGWLRLDPTPSVDDEEDPDPGVVDRAIKSFDYARWLWNDYVLRLTSERQEQTILSPLGRDRRVPLSRWIDADAWREQLRRLANTRPRDLLRFSADWRVGVAMVLVGGGMYLLARSARRLGPHLRQLARIRWPVRRRKRRQSVAFYRRFEAILARRGLRRAPSQTPRVFARRAAHYLATSPDQAPVADLPELIVEAFYRLRFGHWEPTAQQYADIESQLNRLEHAVATVPRATP